MKLKDFLSRAAVGAALVALAGCGSIGEGSTIQSLQLYLAPVGGLEQGALVDADQPTEKLRMFDCFCSNLDALGIFTNGTVSTNFRYRVRFTSSDPTVLDVMNVGDAFNSLCPIAQQGPGLLIPRMAGTATITAEFVGLRDSLTVQVVDTTGNGVDSVDGNYQLRPADDANTQGAVAAGAELPLRLEVTLDGRTRVINGNVTTWGFENSNEDVATISPNGVKGISPGTPMTALASFGACGVRPTTSINVGEIVGLSVAEEPDFRPAPSDYLLAANSSEFLKITASLDYDGNGVADTGAQQDLSTQIKLDFTDHCTLRKRVDGVGNSNLANCDEVPSDACPATTPVCSSSMTSCAAGMADCRLVPATMRLPLLGGNAITALADDQNPTTFTATFPIRIGTPTELTAGVDEFVTTLTVAALSGYPTTPPWDAVIDKGAGAEETVRVTSVSGTTLTVLRGRRGTTAVSHAADAPFAQLEYGLGSVAITADGRELTGLVLEPVATSTTLDAFATLQLNAAGTFDVPETPGTPRTQRVTRLSTVAAGSPRVIWFSSDSSVAFVGSGSGLVTAIGPCGGEATIRARASTSETTATAAFVAPSDTEPDADGNGNADSNDTACADDPLCDQTKVCVSRAANPELFGVTCDDPEITCP